MLLFNPGDNHACVQNGGGNLDYRGLNIEAEVMFDFSFYAVSKLRTGV